MNIDSIKNGYVIDHIKPGKSLEIYEYLKLGQLDTQVAIIKNAKSKKTGKKDIIKIDKLIDIDINILGYLEPKITINKIENGAYVKSSNENIIKFRDYLNENGIVATIRRELGSDIDAACGQLRRKNLSGGK